MISAQKEALEDARQSREDALKATRVHSFEMVGCRILRMLHRSRVTFWRRCPMNFEHHLGILTRTYHGLILFLPSSFYGLLDILSGTELNNGQREIGTRLLAFALFTVRG
jgi:hypothetical protein